LKVILLDEILFTCALTPLYRMIILPKDFSFCRQIFRFRMILSIQIQSKDQKKNQYQQRL